MRRSDGGRRISQPPRALVLLTATTILASASPATPDDTGGVATVAPPPGMRAYVDPRSGALAPEPPASAPPALPSTAHSTEGLVVRNAPGGGVMLDLQGRFQSRLVATVMPDGSVRLSHVDAAE